MAPQPQSVFDTRDFVRPEEIAVHRELAAQIMARFQPEGILENIHANEAITATWRLRRCAALESRMAGRNRSDQPDPMADNALVALQQSIDRARTQAHNLLVKATKEIARLQAERRATPKPPRSPKYLSLDEVEAEVAAIVAKRKTEQSQSRPAAAPPPSVKPPSPTANSVKPAAKPGRNTPCPCNSGRKYKRCCGFAV